MLEIAGVEAGYGPSKVLFGVTLDVRRGEVVTLLGRNGMGKTTTIRAIMGMAPLTAGSIRLQGRDMTGARTFRIAQAGIGLVPEGRQVFPMLSVEENLVATSGNRLDRPDPWTLQRIYDTFPALAGRRRQLASTLSGGEQQMLAIGRALMTNPALLILDEATEGLAPVVRQEIWAGVRRLKAEGLSILVVDKSLKELASVADRAVVLERGTTVWTGGLEDLTPEMADRWLGV